MHLLCLPSDILLDVMDVLSYCSVMRLVCKQLYTLWHNSHVHITEDASGTPVIGSPISSASVRWLRCTGERFQWVPQMVLCPRVLTLHINGWMERWNLCKLLNAYSSSVDRLILRSTATIGPTTFSAICVHLATMLSLRTLELRVLHAHFGDLSCRDLADAVCGMSRLSRLMLVLPMNSITIAGLHNIISGLVKTSIRHLSLDVSGNWIRGTEYGKELGRISQLEQLRSLQLTFGGWGVRKQFGLEHLSTMSSMPALQDLSLTIVGARITCEFFKKAMMGIAIMPRLTCFHLDLSACEVGEQCHRGLALLRLAKRLEQISLCLSHPTERLLSAMGFIHFAPELKRIILVIDHRSQVFTEKHALEMSRCDSMRCSVTVRVQNAKITNTNAVMQRLMEGFASTPEVEVCFSDCILSVPKGVTDLHAPWCLEHIKEGSYMMKKSASKTWW